jgi:Protein of unknown function (DUF2892)
MTLNVGIIDRVLRVIIGVALLAFAVLSTHPYAPFGWIGVAPLVTAAFGTCPLYTLLGISSCPAKQA